jgi:hypothetical protein
LQSCRGRAGGSRRQLGTIAEKTGESARVEVGQSLAPVSEGGLLSDGGPVLEDLGVVVNLNAEAAALEPEQAGVEPVWHLPNTPLATMINLDAVTSVGLRVFADGRRAERPVTEDEVERPDVAVDAHLSEDGPQRVFELLLQTKMSRG